MTESVQTQEPEEIIKELKAENQRLHKKIAQLEVKLISAQNRAEALEDEIKSIKPSTEDAKKKLLQLLGINPKELE